MTKVIDWMLFTAVLAVLAVYGGCEAQPAKTPPPAWDAAKTRQEVEADIAWMRRMNAVEAEQAARDAKAAKEFEEYGGVANPPVSACRLRLAALPRARG